MVASCVAAAFAPPAVGVPRADSAVGVGSILGNSLSLSASAARPLDPESVTVRHTPTGQLFKFPFAVPRLDELAKTASGWEYSGLLELGVIGGDADKRNADFEMYQDVGNGASVNNFGLQMRKPEGGYFVNLTGGGAGRHDQYYGLDFGRFDAWKVKLSFSETPRVYTTTYHSLWSGVGSGFLTLVPGLTPGGTASIPNDNASIAAAARGPHVTLGLTRKRAGARLDLNLSDRWKTYVSYSVEERVGARPLGAVWGSGGGTAPIDIPEPIDHVTQDVLAGVLYADAVTTFNVRLSASLFRNNIDTVTFQEPLRIASAAGTTTVPATGAFTQGRFDLAPSNQAYNARVEYTRALPSFLRGNFNAVVAAGTLRQDDNLIPYTTIPNITLANVSLLPGGNWDTTGSLSRLNSASKIDTRLANLGLSLNPTDALNLKGKFRFYQADNKSEPYLAVNPRAVYIDNNPDVAGNQGGGLTWEGVTGVWGRLANEGSGQYILMGTSSATAGNLPIAGIPFGYKQYNLGPSADYQLSRASSVNAAYEREIFDREHRERKRTWEDKLTVGYVNRGLGNSTVRVSYELGRRRGDKYHSHASEEFVSGALVPMPTAVGSNIASWAVHMNDGFRKFDLADRDRHVVNVRWDTMLRPDLDAGVSLQWSQADFPNSDYGRTKQNQRSANVDLNYQPSPKRSVYAFYSFQQARYDQASIAGSGSALIGQVTNLGTITPANAAAIAPAPGGPLFPLVNAWTAAITDRNHLLGIGVKQEFARVSLNLDYTYTIGHNGIRYAYTPGGAVTVANAPFAGDHFPDQVANLNYLDANLTVPLTERLSLRFFYRYQQMTIRDWHYQNLDGAPVALGAAGATALPTAIILDGGPEDYNANWFGAMLRIKF